MIKYMPKILMLEWNQLIVFMILLFIASFILGYAHGLEESKKECEILEEKIIKWKQKLKDLKTGGD